MTSMVWILMQDNGGYMSSNVSIVQVFATPDGAEAALKEREVVWSSRPGGSPEYWVDSWNVQP